MGTKTKVSAVKRKLITVDEKISEIISRGGKTTHESIESVDKEVRFTVRIPKSWVEKIDEDRRKRVGIVSRNQWILETVSQFVDNI